MRVKPINKYAKLTKELSSEDILLGLLGYGLFPEKVPDFLSSKSFFDWYEKEGKPCFEKKGKDYIRYESMRDINVPRLMAIPNPFAYANLCNELSDNWDKLQKHLIKHVEKQKHKVSRIHIRKLEYVNHLFEMNYKNGYKDGYPEQDIIIGNRFCVEADISNCFPSIYSHSVPWALIGKTKAKKTLIEEDKWVDNIDKKLRNIKFEETNGILIGPHTSNLISELILVVIDDNLWEKGYRYVRNIDDYKCYVKTYEQAEKFLLDLTLELKEFELNLNNKKTKISPLPQLSVSEWVNKLNNFYIGDIKNEDGKVVFKIKKLKAFLDLATELMLKENTSAVLNYAFKIIANTHLGEKALKYYINQAHHLILLYPYLAHVFEKYVIEPFEISSSKFKNIAVDLYKIGIEKGLHEACSYSIYWSIKYDYKIRNGIYTSALKSNDCIFITLAFLYAKKHKEKSIISKFKAKAIELKDIDFDRFWLFIYEALPQTKLDGDFKRIKKEKISFIKP